MTRKERNEKLAKDIIQFCKENECGDTRVYYNGKAVDIDYNGKTKEINDIDPTEYFEYANRETVSMTFEGLLYYILNGYTLNSFSLYDKFEKLFKKYGCYFELGNAWNLAAYDLD